MVTRLVGAKGFDILMPVLDRLLADDVRLVILGKGDAAYETALAIAARKYADRLAYQHDYDETLAHLIEGGSDLTLIPSRVEPGAFSAMHSLKYGVLPIARATRGVEQIIVDYDPSTDTGYGFLFYEYGSEPLWDTIKRAKEVFADRAEWERLMRRAMRSIFPGRWRQKVTNGSMASSLCTRRPPNEGAPRRPGANSRVAQQGNG